MNEQLLNDALSTLRAWGRYYSREQIRVDVYREGPKRQDARSLRNEWKTRGLIEHDRILTNRNPITGESLR